MSTVQMAQKGCPAPYLAVRVAVGVRDRATVGERAGVTAAGAVGITVDDGVAGAVGITVSVGVAGAMVPVAITVAVPTAVRVPPGTGDVSGLTVAVYVAPTVIVNEAVGVILGVGVRVGGPDGSAVGSSVSVGFWTSDRGVAVDDGERVTVAVGIVGVAVSALAIGLMRGSKKIAAMPRQ